MEGIGDEIYDLGIAELAKREGEVRAFDRSVKVAQKAAQDKGIAEVRRVKRTLHAYVRNWTDIGGKAYRKEQMINFMTYMYQVTHAWVIWVHIRNREVDPIFLYKYIDRRNEYSAPI